MSSEHARFLRAYPTANPSLKWAVYERDHFTCQDCGFVGTPGLGSGHIQAHHIVPSNVGGTHEPSNLITLCGQCHTKREAPMRRASWAERRDKHPQLGPTFTAIALALGISNATAADWVRRGLIPRFRTRAELTEYARSPQRRRPRPGRTTR